jgi:hypothetical protein
MVGHECSPILRSPRRCVLEKVGILRAGLANQVKSSHIAVHKASEEITAFFEVDQINKWD